VVVVVLLVVWIYSRLIEQEMDVEISNEAGVSDEMFENLEGRTLIWTTNANVPLQIEWGGEGYSVLQMLGVPEEFRPGDISIGRRPVREEFNIAMIVIGGPGEISDVEYLTENDGSWHKPQISAFADYVVATKFEDEKQSVVRFDLGNGTSETVAQSHSITRWPSITEDGRKIMFHSFRDGTTYGSIFLATMDQAANDWQVEKVPTREGYEFNWPMIDASGIYFLTQSQNMETGLTLITLGHSTSETDEYGIAGSNFRLGIPFNIYNTEVKFPSVSRDAVWCCWNEYRDDQWIIYMLSWNQPRINERKLGKNHPGHGWVQPYISPDGRFVVFIDDNIGPGTDRIGIFDLDLDEVLYIEGCGGNVMFPSISDPPVD